MRLKITHRTQYSYDRPITYALQRLRLVPMNSDCQKVAEWSLELTGAVEEARYTDGFGNDTRLVSVSGGETMLSAVASGTVDTIDRAGITGPHRGYAPLWLFKQHTELTEPGEAIRNLASGVPEGGDLERLHALLKLIVERMDYRKGVTTTATSAEEAMAAGAGVCQDHAHVFISAARFLGFPARYVSGYLMLEDGSQEAASHAWAEGHVDGLGWVAFDPANGISPDGRYARLAVGRDYRDACPMSGLRLGDSRERLEVQVTVEQ